MTNTKDYLEKIKETAAFLNGKVAEMPNIAIILGSGLGNLADIMTDKQVIPYGEIPNFPVSTVAGHKGNLIFGKLGDKNVVAMQGRFHYYEGYDMKTVTFPVRVFKALGIETLIVSNAAGGMNKEFKVGDVMIITDQINLFPENPLRGHNYDELGPRFPAMTEAYDHELIKIADAICNEQNIRIMHGVYVGTTGPTFETPAEYEYFRVIGGDAVGMSTVPEVIVARHGGMRCFGVSVITDLGGKDILVAPSHEEVMEAADNAAPTMRALVTELVSRI